MNLVTAGRPELDGIGGVRIPVTAHLSTDWVAVGWYFEASNALRLGELRVFPGEVRTGVVAVDEWSNDPRVLEALPAPHEIYKRLLTRVPLLDMYRVARTSLDLHQARTKRDEDDLDGKTWTEKEAGAENRLIERAIASAPTADDRLTPANLDYLEAAAIYARLTKPSRRAVADVLENVTVQQVQDRLKAARKKTNGEHLYLDTPGPGRRGGHLTPRGERLAAIYLKPSGERLPRPKKSTTPRGSR